MANGRPVPVIMQGPRRVSQARAQVNLGDLSELTGEAERRRQEETEALLQQAILEEIFPTQTQAVPVEGITPTTRVGEAAITPAGRQAFTLEQLSAANIPGLTSAAQQRVMTPESRERVEAARRVALTGGAEGVKALRALVQGTQAAQAKQDVKAPTIKEDETGRLRFATGGRAGQLVYPDVLTGEEAADIARKKIRGKTGSEAESELRGEFVKQSGDFTKVRDASARVAAAGQDPSAAGDLALIFNYMKILDPGSVVRESEFANAKNSAGVPDRIRATYNGILRGERLAPATRADFMDKARELFESQQELHNQRIAEYTRLAENEGLNPANVIIDISLPPEPAAAARTTVEESPEGTRVTEETQTAEPTKVLRFDRQGRRIE